MRINPKRVETLKFVVQLRQTIRVRGCHGKLKKTREFAWKRGEGRGFKSHQARCFSDSIPDKRFFIGVKALITDSKGKLLIMRKAPGSTDRWKPFWDLPGGKMQQAGIKETLLKEAKEELGISNLRIGPLFDVAISNFNIHDREGAVLGGLLYVLYECKLPAGSKLKSARSTASTNGSVQTRQKSCCPSCCPEISSKNWLQVCRKDLRTIAF